MIVECWVIVVMVLAMAVIIARRSGPAQGIAILPLGIVPFVYVVSGPLSRWLKQILPAVSESQFHVSLILIALVFACVLFGALAGNMGGKGARRAYMFLCGGFSVALAIVLIHSIQPF